MRIERGRFAALALIPALALALTACGGGDDDDGSPSAGASLAPTSGAPVPGASNGSPDSPGSGTPGSGGTQGGQGSGGTNGNGAGGSGGANGTNRTNQPKPGPTPKAMLDFMNCMHQHGFNIEAGKPIPKNVDQSKFKAATLGCVKYLRSPQS